MKKIFSLLCTALIILCAGSFSRADFFTANLQPVGSNTRVNDTSFENVTKGAGNMDTAHLQTGDILTGVVTYNAVGSVGSPASVPSSIEVTAVFQSVVTVGTTIPNVGTPLSLAPTAAFQAQFGTGAMAALFEDDAGTPLTTLAANDQTNNTSSPLSAYVSAAESGTLLAAVGFTGAGGTATGGEGWSSLATSLLIQPQPISGQSATYSANLDLITSGNSALVNSPNYIFSNSQASTFGNPTQFFLTGTVFSQQSNAFNAATFGSTDNSSVTFDVNAVPEPSSLILLGIGTGAFGLVGFVRRKKQAIAA